MVKGASFAALIFAIGTLSWTLLEYNLHRYRKIDCASVNVMSRRLGPRKFYNLYFYAMNLKKMAAQTAKF